MKNKNISIHGIKLSNTPSVGDHSQVIGKVTNKSTLFSIVDAVVTVNNKLIDTEPLGLGSKETNVVVSSWTPVEKGSHEVCISAGEAKKCKTFEVSS